MAKLWGGRFSTESSALLETFNASIHFDKRMWREDILGSQIHARMLGRIGVLTESEVDSICKGLDSIGLEIEKGEFEWNVCDEDIHMAVETRLTQKIGDLGKKLHTARSRNDQVAVDFRLYVLRANKNVRVLLLELLATLVNLAKEHTESIMPGMTHLQHAQPISLGFALCAWAAQFKRDVERLKDDYERNNFCPLGSGALAGTPYGNDRVYLAESLGFYAPTLNAMDSVSDRDFALDMLYSLSMVMMHISRVAEEFVLWSSSEFRFITLSDAYATGSSIMPQKKNPDIPELLRGKSGRVYGNLMGLLCVMKGLAFAYNKDTQEDKEAVFDSIDTLCISLQILNECLKTSTFHTQRMQQMASIGHLSATDLADFLVCKCGVAFRDAHHITGQVVAYAESKNVDISELCEEEIRAIDVRIGEGVGAVLNLRSSMEARDTLGGTASRRVVEQITQLEDFIAREQVIQSNKHEVSIRS